MDCAPVRSFSEGIIDRTGAQTMLYLTCTTISSVDLAHYGVLRSTEIGNLVIVVQSLIPAQAAMQSDQRGRNLQTACKNHKNVQEQDQSNFQKFSTYFEDSSSSVLSEDQKRGLLQCLFNHLNAFVTDENPI